MAIVEVVYGATTKYFGQLGVEGRDMDPFRELKTGGGEVESKGGGCRQEAFRARWKTEDLAFWEHNHTYLCCEG